MALAEDAIRKSVVRAPIAGTVYQFDLKPGAYLNAGDLVATIGQLDRVRVKVFVDEPDLGRVARGNAGGDHLGRDARPAMEGKVDRTPTQIVALGTRQVGEVVCVIDNPERELLPGTNVNVEITRADGAQRADDSQGGGAASRRRRPACLCWRANTLDVEENHARRLQHDAHAGGGLNEGDAVALGHREQAADKWCSRLRRSCRGLPSCSSFSTCLASTSTSMFRREPGSRRSERRVREGVRNDGDANNGPL